MYEHIIVPFDGSAQARQSAAIASDLAMRIDAELVLATVGGAVPVGALEGLKHAAVSFSDERATMWVEPGPVAVDALMRMASYRPRSLICMYTHARTGVLGAVYGSLADQLLDGIETPLLLIGPECPKIGFGELNHMVVCVDRSPASQTAVSLATDWAEMFPLNVTVVYVRDRDEIAADVDRLIAPLEARCGIVDRTVFEHGTVVEGVVDIVRNSENAVVVMASSPASGVARLTHGGIVARMSQHVPVPVLARRTARPGAPDE